MLMLKKNFTPENALESAVLSKDNAAIVELIAAGAQLKRPDVLAAKEAFELYYPVAVLLLESSPCLRSESAVKELETLNAEPEMIDLVRETALPLPENTHSRSAELLEALNQGDEIAAVNLILIDNVSLYSGNRELLDNISDFSETTTEALLDQGLAGRLQAQIFLELRDNLSPENELFFEILKAVIKEPVSPERDKAVHALWHRYTTSPFVKAIEAEPEKYSDEYLADMIIDQELSFSVRPFKAFAPYWQALMLNNAGVNPDQFGEEAEIEKFDAQAVFELLRYSDEYADRVNWELVNKTANASEYLTFLAAHPQYADKADWQMLNCQASVSDWGEFLVQHPAFLEKHQDHAALYCDFPVIWEEKILSKANIPYGSCFALLRLDYPDYYSCFKVRIKEGKAEFFEVSDPESYQKYAELAEKNIEEFCAVLKNPDLKNETPPDPYQTEERFVPVIR